MFCTLWMFSFRKGRRQRGWTAMHTRIHVWYTCGRHHLQLMAVYVHGACASLQLALSPANVCARMGHVHTLGWHHLRLMALCMWRMCRVHRACSMCACAGCALCAVALVMTMRVQHGSTILRAQRACCLPLPGHVAQTFFSRPAADF